MKYNCTFEPSKEIVLKIQSMIKSQHINPISFNLDNGELAGLERKDLAKLKTAEISFKSLKNHDPNVLSNQNRTPFATKLVDCHLDAEDTIQHFIDLEKQYQGYCKLEKLPYQSLGYNGKISRFNNPQDIWMFKISPYEQHKHIQKLGFLLICGTHGRELLNPVLAVELASQLLWHYKNGSDDIKCLLKKSEVFIVPAMNPDGLNFAYHHKSGWRKNRRVLNFFNSNDSQLLPNQYGVDNNRNYPVYFGLDGSAHTECSENPYYHGPFPFSENENKNIAHIIKQNPHIFIALDVHTGDDPMGMYRPALGHIPKLNKKKLEGLKFDFHPDQHVDELTYKALGDAAIQEMNSINVSNYEIFTNGKYAGTSNFYMYHMHKIFAFTVEHYGGKTPQIEEGVKSIEEVINGAIALLRKAHVLR